MDAPKALADTIYGCGTPSVTRHRARRSRRPIRSRAPSRARWASSGTPPGCQSAQPRASSVRRRPNSAAWKTRATSPRCDRCRDSRACMATTSRSTSPCAAYHRRAHPRRRRW